MEEEVRLHPILSNAEVEEARKKARQRVQAERKKAAAKAVEEAEVERLAREEGMRVEEGPGSEVVSITIDLPDFAPCLTINMQPYWHGFTYQVQRHVADSLREMIGRAWHHEHREVEGKSAFQIYKKRNTVLSGTRGAINAPQVMN